MIVGGGLIGLEVAASAVSRGASATVIEAGPRLLGRAAPEAMAALIKAKHEHAGVRIETGIRIERVKTLEGRSMIVLADGRTLSADLVVVGIGAEPNVQLARAAGLSIDNGIALDERLATSDPDIFGAGDCCSFPHRLYKKRIRIEAWLSAQQQGAAAAASMLGASQPYEKIPWFWSDQYDRTLQVVGLPQEEDTLYPGISVRMAPSSSIWRPTPYGRCVRVWQPARDCEGHPLRRDDDRQGDRAEG